MKVCIQHLVANIVVNFCGKEERGGRAKQRLPSSEFQGQGLSSSLIVPIPLDTVTLQCFVLIHPNLNLPQIRNITTMPPTDKIPTTVALPYRPAYAHPDDDGWMCETVYLLDFDNYSSWASCMRTFFFLAGLEDFVYNVDDPMTDLPDHEKEFHRIQNGKALRAMRMSMNLFHRQFYDSAEYASLSAAQLWITIREHERSRIDPLRERLALANIFLEECGHIRKYLQALRDGIWRLEFAKSTAEESWTMPADEVCFFYLQGLPRDDQWADFRLSFTVRQMEGTKNPEVLGQMITGFWEVSDVGKRWIAEEEDKERRMKQMRCFKCKKKGHAKKDCPN